MKKIRTAETQAKLPGSYIQKVPDTTVNCISINPYQYHGYLIPNAKWYGMQNGMCPPKPKQANKIYIKFLS